MIYEVKGWLASQGSKIKVRDGFGPEGARAPRSAAAAAAAAGAGVPGRCSPVGRVRSRAGVLAVPQKEFGQPGSAAAAAGTRGGGRRLSRAAANPAPGPPVKPLRSWPRLRARTRSRHWMTFWTPRTVGRPAALGGECVKDGGRMRARGRWGAHASRRRRRPPAAGARAAPQTKAPAEHGARRRNRPTAQLIPYAPQASHRPLTLMPCIAPRPEPQPQPCCCPHNPAATHPPTYPNPCSRPFCAPGRCHGGARRPGRRAARGGGALLAGQNRAGERGAPGAGWPLAVCVGGLGGRFPARLVRACAR